MIFGLSFPAAALRRRIKNTCCDTGPASVPRVVLRILSLEIHEESRMLVAITSAA